MTTIETGVALQGGEGLELELKDASFVHRHYEDRLRKEEEAADPAHPGRRVEALRHALGANALNGVYRTNGDKRNAVEMISETPGRTAFSKGAEAGTGTSCAATRLQAFRPVPIACAACARTSAPQPKVSVPSCSASHAFFQRNPWELYMPGKACLDHLFRLHPHP